MTRTHRTALLAALGVCGMTGLGFASVPLYRMFCEATGLDGTTNRAEDAPGAVGRKITVAFDSNVGKGLDWAFRPEVEQDTIDIGARDMAFFTATNRSGAPITGTATFNVTPAQAGRYFTKIQCFCFTEQTLQPGETVRMPVTYFVDPKLLDDPDARDIDTITLSYTFYPIKKPA
ncbi:cytochrome c oxidase assembly protein subunit 11 [Sphingomonas guangdongensis]|uniref:Cytochrome c oxidase assembly protein CtaG n=1 Tax=Sphingomonas guangdongensis TaxID=1141890 RepID=A0A285QDP2_9SPHN|nr:cytochrome c oxidase assembly protein [Sphingomonas guangdongensis]SOB79594.1 cytochrome c oxidase assembly protein subunit 11 [Sphingomonas guangdongensis]